MGLFGKSKDDKPKKLTSKVLWEQYYRATQEQQWAGAVDALKQLRRREPDNDKISMKLGDALQRMGNTREAVTAYHEAAEATVASGFAQKALAIYKIILRLAPGDEEARERSREIVEMLESGAQQRAAAAETQADTGGLEAFEGYGSLDSSTPAETAMEPDEQPPMEEPAYSGSIEDMEPEPGPEVESVPGLEQTAYENQPGGLSLMDSQEGPEPGPEVETVPGLEQTAYEDQQGGLSLMESLVEPEPMPEVESVPGLEQTAYEDQPDASEDAEPQGGLEHAEEDLLALSEPEPASGRQDAAEEFRLPQVFAFLIPEEQEEFIAKARTVPYEHGQSIISEGETGDSMYIIKQGTARVVTEIMDREVELAQLGPGDFFGEVAFLTGRPRTASVVALGGMELLEVDKPLLQETIDKNPLILDSLVELYHSRAQDTVEKIKGGRS